ncbi:MAG: hypothetical protein JNL96_15640 [Planctomycetaceae bacterium]|nr:hypothetical protein [Planctomycetaceae bacterium]
MKPRNGMILIAIVGACLAAGTAGRLIAEPTASATPAAAQATPKTEDGLAQAMAQVQKVLDDAEYFYKTPTDDNGVKYFVVLFETAEGKTQIYIDVSEIGTIGGQKVYGYVAYAPVGKAAAEGENLPPGVIKLVANENNRTSLGYFSVSKDNRQVYSSASGVIDGLTKTALKMTLYYLHENNLDFVKSMEPILKEAGSSQ